MPTHQQIAAWLGRLVQIPSVSPDQAGPRAGAPGEAKLAAEVAQWFRQFGGEVYTEDVLPGRPNVYGLWRAQSERWLAVDVHLDTVSVEQMTGDPFSGHVENGRVYGRGAVDTKASLAIILALLEELHQTGQSPKTNLLIAATVDEEVGATGAPAAASWIRQHQLPIDQLIVAEPTLCTPIYGHKGVARMQFHVQGEAAHSSQPQRGQNAVVAAAYLVMAFQEEHEQLYTSPPTPLGKATLTVTIMQGGTGINVVPDACSISIDRRLVNGEKATEVCANLYQVAQEACPLPVTMNTQKEIDAFFQSPDSPWLLQLVEWSGNQPQVAPYGTNAWAYADLARECIVFGPGSIDQAHGAEEWVALDELEKAAAIYAHWWGLA
ncbi:MAG: M20/M25/M40 family metallo-hydrolase [Chloroflexi bacterium]|nr:M20/M25/M40 family metallo-hydrolase [Chloroflexota bacterium]